MLRLGVGRAEILRLRRRLAFRHDGAHPRHPGDIGRVACIDDGGGRIVRGHGGGNRLRRELRGKEIFAISGVSRQGVEKLLESLWHIVREQESGAVETPV